MVTTIVCDKHARTGSSDVPANTYVITIRNRTTGGHGITREIDVCGECGEPIEAVSELVRKYGRRPEATNGQHADES
jgi:hypothetical protein